jgi:hypothetical protein
LPSKFGEVRGLVAELQDTAQRDAQQKRNILWVIPFIVIELVIAVGALIGVALLDSSWVKGLGIFNMKVAIVIGILPSLVLAVIASNTTPQLKSDNR